MNWKGIRDGNINKFMKIFIMMFIMINIFVFMEGNSSASKYSIKDIIISKETFAAYAPNGTGDYKSNYDVSNPGDLDSLGIRFYFKGIAEEENGNRAIGSETYEGSAINCYIKTSKNKIIMASKVNIIENQGVNNHLITAYFTNIRENFSGKLYIGENNAEVNSVSISCIKENSTSSEVTEKAGVLEGVTGVCNISVPKDKKYHFVYFGDTKGSSSYSIKGPILNRVLYTKANKGSAEGFSPDKGANALFMLAEYGIGSNAWDTADGQDWLKSSVRAWLNESVYNDCFSADEQEVIYNTTTIYDKNRGTPLEWTYAYSGNEVYYATKQGATTKTNALNSDRLFLLSAEEVTCEAYGFSSKKERRELSYFSFDDKDRCYIGDKNGNNNSWWLRSAITNYNNYVTEIDYHDHKGWRNQSSHNTQYLGVRFALNLDPSYIIYASKGGDDGKSTCEFREIDSIKQVAANPAQDLADNSAYKLTIKDSTTGAKFFIRQTSVTCSPGESITLNYSSCQTGEGQNICAIIKKEGSTCYFARLAVDVQESYGTLNLTIPSDLDTSEEYKLIVYNETNNGVKRTNTARCYEVTLNVSEVTEEVILATQLGISKDGPWYSNETELRENLYQTETIEMLYMKVEATSSIDGVTPTITIHDDINKICSLLSGTTNIFKITGNTPLYSSPLIVEAKGKTSSATDSRSIKCIGSPGNKNPITITLKYGLSQNGSWVNDQSKLNATSISKVYVQATATSAKGDLDENLEWLDKDGEDIGKGTGGSSEGKITSVKEFSENMEFKVKAKIKNNNNVTKIEEGEITVCSTDTSIVKLSYAITADGPWHQAEEAILRDTLKKDKIKEVYVKIYGSDLKSIEQVKLESTVVQPLSGKTNIYVFKSNGNITATVKTQQSGKAEMTQTVTGKITQIGKSGKASITFEKSFALSENGTYHTEQKDIINDLQNSTDIVQKVYAKVTATLKIENISNVSTEPFGTPPLRYNVNHGDGTETDYQGTGTKAKGNKSGTTYTQVATTILEFTQNDETFNVEAVRGNNITSWGPTISDTISVIGAKKGDDTESGGDDNGDEFTTGETIEKPQMLDVTLGSETAISSNFIETIRLRIDLKDIDFSKINWSIDEIQWNLDSLQDTKLRYKDYGQETKVSKKYEVIDIMSPLDVCELGNIGGTTYFVHNNDNTNETLESYTGTGSKTNTKTKDGVTITDVPFEADSKITISCTSDNPVTVTLSPSNLISKVREVGIRVEYELNGYKYGMVKVFKYIPQSGEVTYTFKNVPSNATYSAYYIDMNGNKFSTV